MKKSINDSKKAKAKFWYESLLSINMYMYMNIRLTFLLNRRIIS